MGCCQSISATARSAQKPTIVLPRLCRAWPCSSRGLDAWRACETPRTAETRGPRAGPIECLSAPLVYSPESQTAAAIRRACCLNILPNPCVSKKHSSRRRVRRSWLQIIQRRLQRNVADDPGQAPRQIRGFLVREQFRGDCGCAAQLQCRNSVEDLHTAHRANRTCANSTAAVFLPTPGTPGMLSTLSPVRARKSAMSSGTTPKRGPMSW